MAVSPKLLCTVVAVVLFAIAALIGFWSSWSKVNLIAAGLFFWALGDLFG